MRWYVIVEQDQETGREDVVTDPDNHWPAVKIEKHRLEKENPGKKYTIVKTSY